MSEREKKLVILLGIGLFLFANFFGFNYYTKAKTDFTNAQRKAETDLKTANAYASQYDSQTAQMEWLSAHKPQPKSPQAAQNQLQQTMVNFAAINNLTVKKQTLLAAVDGVHFSRARVQFLVTGMELGFYAWLDKLQMPDQLMTITHLKVAPLREDDTKIEATVEVSQFYIPLVGGASAQTSSTESSEPEPDPVETSDPTPDSGPVPAPSDSPNPGPTPDPNKPDGP